MGSEDAESWDELAARIGRWARWEFEDYIEPDDEPDPEGERLLRAALDAYLLARSTGSDRVDLADDEPSAVPDGAAQSLPRSHDQDGPG